MRDGRVVVQLPAGLAAADEQRMVTTLVRRVTGQARAAAAGGDEQLAARCAELADRWLDGVRATEVRWSGRMTRRYASCTPATGVVRVSREVAGFPAWVQDSILLHELAHLQVPDHSPAFHALLDRHPRRAEADAWLDGYRAGRGAATLPTPGEPDGAAGTS